MKKEILGVMTGLVLFATAAMAQVEQPSQISFQGTGLFTKDSNTDSASQRATNSGGLLVGYSYQFNNWAGVEGNYGYSRNTQNFFRNIRPIRHTHGLPRSHRIVRVSYPGSNRERPAIRPGGRRCADFQSGR